MPCEEPIYSKCDAGHDNSYLCHNGPSCAICAKEKESAEKQQKELFIIKQKHDLEQRDHDRKMAELDDMIKTERQNIRDAQIARERDDALRQKMKDLEETRALADAAKASSSLSGSFLPSFKNTFAPSDSSTPTQVPPTSSPASATSPPPNSQTQSFQSSGSPQSNASVNTVPLAIPDEWRLKASEAKEEWERQKRVEGANNTAIDAIMGMTGLESVKAKVLRIKDKIDTSKRQNASLKNERFNIVLLGNPGTGADLHISIADRTDDH